jgi:hypothetical protein
MMVDDHSKGLADVKTLASAKGTELPDGPDVKHKATALEFKALKGDTFDSRYVKQAGVGDHEATEKLLKKTQAEAKDADLKALAGKMLPIVQGHLQHARNWSPPPTRSSNRSSHRAAVCGTKIEGASLKLRPRFALRVSAISGEGEASASRCR